eukprot:1194715-Prorocentrum_minimum.AAC.1
MAGHGIPRLRPDGVRGEAARRLHPANADVVGDLFDLHGAGGRGGDGGGDGPAAEGLGETVQGQRDHVVSPERDSVRVHSVGKAGLSLWSESPDDAGDADEISTKEISVKEVPPSELSGRNPSAERVRGVLRVLSGQRSMWCKSGGAEPAGVSARS